ncbi:MAG: hypothetical protein JO113_08750 [Candidatus Eremiobacteraeota bacterium]|nr:hypothetical protein [Candidatus Eremiobacteraeota bacterium]
MRFVLLVVCGVVLASCGCFSTLAPASTGQKASGEASPASAFRTIYSFQGAGSGDGSYPTSGVIFAHGELYGTTSAGGLSSQDAGTAFKATVLGSESVIHSFEFAPYGAYPQELLPNKDFFYGLAGDGGTHNEGVVFRLAKSGLERVLHEFSGAPDGAYPNGSLILVKGTLYGTTSAGGRYGVGIVFTVTQSGKERVLYSFKLGTDAAFPAAGLVDVNGTLYGTSSAGGAYNWGTVFAISLSGKEHVIYSFKGGADGASPTVSLIDVGGLLYGTTSAGGGYHDDGIVFAVSPSGKERVLHRFRGTPDDGAMPESPLIYVSGVLYGTTNAGGIADLGTIYRVTTSGRLRLLHAFASQAEGENPQGPLLDVGGVLYGTANGGGVASGCSCGTIFAFLP